MERRYFLKVAGLGLVGALTSCASSWNVPYSSETVANQFVDNFPAEIPGARKVEKFKFPCASDCLVHIRQIHRIKEITPKELMEVRKVQGNIYDIISYLHDNDGLRDVYLEGVTPETEKSLDGLLKLERGIFDYQREHPKLYEKAMKSLSPKQQEELSESRMIEMWGDGFGATGRLFAEGEIKIKAAETLKANVEAEISFEGGSMWYATDHRENVLLKILSRTNNFASYVVYGGAHDWRNNISEWNRNHREKFSLIRITPESYE